MISASALDLLMRQLGQPGQSMTQAAPPQDWYRMAEEMLERMQRDPGLEGSMNRVSGVPTEPEATYGEGENIPSRLSLAGEPLFDQELMARLFGGQREQQLFGDIQGGRELAREGVWPMPEGAMQSFSPDSPYSSPLNQMLRRPPFGQY